MGGRRKRVVVHVQEKKVAPNQGQPPEPKQAAPDQAPKPARKPPPKTVVGASMMQLLASCVEAGPKLLAGLQELREVGSSAATSAAMRLPPPPATGSCAHVQGHSSPSILTATELLSAAVPSGAPTPAPDSRRLGAAAIVGRSSAEAHAHTAAETACSSAPDRMVAMPRADRPTHAPAAADPAARTGIPLSRASAGGPPTDRAPPAAAAGSPTAQPQRWPGRPGASAGGPPANRVPSGAAAGGPPAQLHRWPGRPGAGDAASERPGRAQAAEDRAHNAAVLAEAALSSEVLARLLQERELRGARGAGRYSL